MYMHDVKGYQCMQKKQDMQKRTRSVSCPNMGIHRGRQQLLVQVTCKVQVGPSVGNGCMTLLQPASAFLIQARLSAIHAYGAWYSIMRSSRRIIATPCTPCIVAWSGRNNINMAEMQCRAQLPTRQRHTSTLKRGPVLVCLLLILN